MAMPFPTTRVHLGNLPHSAVKAEIMQHFEEFKDDIGDLWVARTPPGFGFIYIRNERVADFVAQFNGSDLKGRPVKVEVATGKDRPRNADGKPMEKMVEVSRINRRDRRDDSRDRRRRDDSRDRRHGDRRRREDSRDHRRRDGSRDRKRRDDSRDRKKRDDSRDRKKLDDSRDRKKRDDSRDRKKRDDSRDLKKRVEDRKKPDARDVIKTEEISRGTLRRGSRDDSRDRKRRRRSPSSSSSSASSRSSR